MNDIIPNTIVNIGCSWSRSGCNPDYPFEDGVTYSWPELLQQDLGEHYRVLNYSMNGLSNQMILHLTERLCRDFAGQALCFILQFTRPNRQTFVIDFETQSDLANIHNLIPSYHTTMEDLPYKELPYVSGNSRWDCNELGICPAWPGKLAVEDDSDLCKVYKFNLLHARDKIKFIFPEGEDPGL